MNSMFSGCILLKNLPDISNWDTSNVVDMSKMFMCLKHIISFPDISKWKIQKVTTMEEMFYFCTNLIFLPDISNWDLSQVFNFTRIFGECQSLQVLPDISKWNTKNVINMTGMFLNCSSLKSLPKLDNWNIHNLKDNFRMFEGCNPNFQFPNAKLRPDNRVRIKPICFGNYLDERINALEIRGGPFGDKMQIIKDPYDMLFFKYDLFNIGQINNISNNEFEILIPWERFSPIWNELRHHTFNIYE